MTTASIERTADGATDEPADSLAPLDADERFHLLQNERRRSVIRYLRNAESDAEDGRVRMRDIAEQVAAWEHDTTVAELSSTERQRVYIPLYQNHLPKLDEAGVIEYNQSRGVVVPTERVERLAPFVEESGAPGTDADDAEADADLWSECYLGASGVGTVMLGGAALSLLPGLAVGATILALFSIVSVSQYLSQTGVDGGA